MSGAHYMKLKKADTASYNFFIWIVGFQAVADKRRFWSGHIILIVESASHEEQIWLLSLSIVKVLIFIHGENCHFPDNRLNILPVAVGRSY